MFENEIGVEEGGKRIKECCVVWTGRGKRRRMIPGAGTCRKCAKRTSCGNAFPRDEVRCGTPFCQVRGTPECTEKKCVWRKFEDHIKATGGDVFLAVFNVIVRGRKAAEQQRRPPRQRQRKGTVPIA